MNRRGFSLIELSVVLALIGITTTIAAVSLSSHETELRTYARDFRFLLEKAKQEAVARNVPVELEYFDPAPFDCNGDGVVNGRDRCVRLFAERDGVDGFDAVADAQIDLQLIPPSISFSGTSGLRFSPFGGSRYALLEIQTAVRTDDARCASQCLSIGYPVRINHVGGIEIGRKDETCASCSLCDSCS